MLRQYRILFSMFIIILGLVLVTWLVGPHGGGFTGYMYMVFNHIGPVFSCLLTGLFIAGVYVILDRVAFFGIHLIFSRRLILDNPMDSSTDTVFSIFLRAARELRATSANSVYSDDIVDRAREVALRDALDGQEIDRGRSLLEFLGTIAPMIGFVGTLVGLIESFRELGLGGRLIGVLEGLAVAMTTSLLGVTISVIFLSAAWVLGKARQAFDAKLYWLLTAAKETDRPGG